MLGKGRSKQPLESLPEGERVAFAARQAEVAFRSKQIMAEKIKENEQEELFYEVEMPLLYILADMKHRA